jgi:hypothetical protein
MNPTLMDIIKYVGGVTVFTGFLYWILRFAINKFAEAGLINYKAGLDKELASHKADLTRVTEEHKIRFELLHLERAKTIQNLHEKICVCEDALYQLTTLAQGPEWAIDESRHQKALSELGELLQATRASRLYLPKTLSDKLEELRLFSVNIVFQMKGAKTQHQSNERIFSMYSQVTSDQLEKPLLTWSEAERKVREDFKSSREQIESAFRKVLGEA